MVFAGWILYRKLVQQVLDLLPQEFHFLAENSQFPEFLCLVAVDVGAQLGLHWLKILTQGLLNWGFSSGEVNHALNGFSEQPDLLGLLNLVNAVIQVHDVPLPIGRDHPGEALLPMFLPWLEDPSHGAVAVRVEAKAVGLVCELPLHHPRAPIINKLNWPMQICAIWVQNSSIISMIYQSNSPFQLVALQINELLPSCKNSCWLLDLGPSSLSTCAKYSSLVLSDLSIQFL